MIRFANGTCIDYRDSGGRPTVNVYVYVEENAGILAILFYAPLMTSNVNLSVADLKDAIISI
jgi:hypothetical protein